MLICWLRLDGHLAHGQCVKSRQINFESDARCVGRCNCATRADDHRRLDNVFFPIARAGGHVAGQTETSESGHRDVVRATDPRFEHAAAPDRNVSFARHLLESLCFSVTADAAEFDVYDLARTEIDRMDRDFG